MTVLVLPTDDASYLARWPESGIGFQLMDLTLRDRGPGLYLLFNSRYLLEADDPRQLTEALKDIAIAGVRSLRQYGDRRDVSLRNEPGALSGFREPSLAAGRPSPEPFSEAAQQILRPQPLLRVLTGQKPQAYFRFSAFPKDRRVRPDGGFTPGTYATTFNDLRMVPSGYAAVGRYALPNPLPARFVYPIVTDAAVHIGTAVPNFGQAGGGVEVMFPAGAPLVAGKAQVIPDG